MTRAKDILVEVERQLRPLERQAGKAVEHSRLAEELRDLEVALAVEQLRGLQAEWDGMLKVEREQEADIDLSRYRLTEREADLGKFQTLLEEKGLFVGDLSEQRRRLQAVLERLNSGLLLLEEKGKHLIERLSELRAKLHHSESRIGIRTEELDRLAEERGSADAQLKEHYNRLGELRRETEAARKGRLASEEALAQTNTELRRLRKQTDDARIEQSKLDQALSAYALETDMIATRDEALVGRRASLHDTLSGRRTRLDQAASTLTHTRKELSLADSDVDKRVRVLEARRKELGERRDALAHTRGGIRGLEEIDRAFATASPGLAWALSKERELPGIVGPLAESLRAEAGFESLVETALGPDLFALVVEDADAALRIAASLRDNAAGDVTLLVLDRARPSGKRPTGDLLLDHVTCDKRLRPLLDSLIGDIVLADGLADALSSAADTPGARYATRDGEIAWSAGKVTVGPAQDAGAGVLARKRLLNELTDEAQALEARVGEAEASASAAEEALSAAQQDALELGQKAAALSGDTEALRGEIGRLELELTALESEAASLAGRTLQIDELTAKDRGERDAAAASIESFAAESTRLEEMAAAQAEARDSRFREESATSERLSTCQVDIATVSEREVHLKRQVASATSDLNELRGTIEQSHLTEQGLEVLRERVQPVHDLYAGLLARAEHWAEKLRDRARFEQSDSQSLRDTIHAAQDAVREAQAEIDAKTADMSEIREDKARLEVLVKTGVVRIVEEMGVPLETAMTGEPLPDRDAALDRVVRLGRQIDNLGPVNVVAVQEFDAVKRRRDSMGVQVEDLVGSRKALQRVINAIDRKMRDRFLVTFEQVDRHFQEVFALLFPGGHASLALTDPDDPETTGVEVTAQPPGKKLLRLSLMSGGEKSLTALALLFAVYRTRPCPFYVLDEVDHALDDTNLRRFVAFVDSMRSHTQFVIVTHQRRTMEMADVLYGVSMQADGVSKAVSQRLDRSAEAAPVS
ncbi:MAG: chromosome segregation protein SMC [Coriobacteriaceae bacterium]|nr:chromosome segregation protein SMC [Coriobacteriaceae bacterium]